MPELTINLDATVDFLVGVLKTPSPTRDTPEGLENLRQPVSAIPKQTG